jgi:hypothetical protein
MRRPGRTTDGEMCSCSRPAQAKARICRSRGGDPGPSEADLARRVPLAGVAGPMMTGLERMFGRAVVRQGSGETVWQRIAFFIAYRATHEGAWPLATARRFATLVSLGEEESFRTTETSELSELSAVTAHLPRCHEIPRRGGNRLGPTRRCSETVPMITAPNPGSPAPLTLHRTCQSP